MAVDQSRVARGRLLVFLRVGRPCRVVQARKLLELALAQDPLGEALRPSATEDRVYSGDFQDVDANAKDHAAVSGVGLECGGVEVPYRSLRGIHQPSISVRASFHRLPVRLVAAQRFVAGPTVLQPKHIRNVHTRSCQGHIHALREVCRRRRADDAGGSTLLDLTSPLLPARCLP